MKGSFSLTRSIVVLLVFLSILIFSLFHLGEPFNLDDYESSQIDSLVFECANKHITIAKDSINNIQAFCDIIKKSEKITEGSNYKTFNHDSYELTIYFKDKSIDQIHIAHNKKNNAKMICNVGLLNDYYYFNYKLYLFVASKLKCERDAN